MNVNIFLLGGLLALVSSAPAGEYIEVGPERLSVEPTEYVGVPIKLKCRFVKLDSTWLNDREVYRSAEKYVGFVVEAGDRIFAQLFYPRDKMSYLSRFESKDRLIIYGRVFSAKYNFPWIEVDKITEGWIIGEEPEEVKNQRLEVAKDYEDFIKARNRILRELKLDDVREIFIKQEALIQLLIEKKVFTQREFEDESASQKVRPTPPPAWEILFKDKD